MYIYASKKNLLGKFKFKIKLKWYIFILIQVVINLSSQKCILVQNNLDLTLQNKSIKFFSTKLWRRYSNYKNRCSYKLEHLLFYYYSLAGINYSEFSLSPYHTRDWYWYRISARNKGDNIELANNYFNTNKL